MNRNLYSEQGQNSTVINDTVPSKGSNRLLPVKSAGITNNSNLYIFSPTLSLKDNTINYSHEI